MKWITALLYSVGAAGVSAQSITYNSFNFGSGQPVATLKDMTAAGASDRTVNTGLTEPGFPAWSRDGKTLALSSPDPLRPSKVSRDLYLMDATTSAVRKLYTFEDYADGDGFHTQFPVAKAFSPNGTRLAVSLFLQTSVVNSGITTLPLLYLFDTSGLEPPMMLSLANLRDGVNLEGLGCDWSSTNQIAWPGSCGSYSYYNGVYIGLVNGTCINILQPNVSAPQPRQLTFPVVRTIGNASFTQKKAEVDYAPAFSPNGNFVAFVRVTRTVENLVNLPDQCSIRLVNINGIGDTELLRLNPGFWVTQLSWSSDGNQLLFDLGAQQVASGQPLPQAAPATVELHSLNMNTLTPGRLHVAPAVWPAWRPVAPSLAIRAVPGTANVELTWPVGSPLSKLQSTTNLTGTWGNVTTSPAVGNWLNQLTLPRDAPAKFFRLTNP